MIDVGNKRVETDGLTLNTIRPWPTKSVVVRCMVKTVKYGLFLKYKNDQY